MKILPSPILPVRRFGDALGHVIRTLIVYPNRDFHFRQKRHAIFAAHVAIQIAFLPAITLRLPDDARGNVGIANVAEHRFRRTI